MPVAKSLWWALGSLVPMVVGAFGPWARLKILNLSVNGTDNGKDGWLVVGAAAGGLVFLALYAALRSRWPAILAFLAGCSAAAVAAYDIADIKHVASGRGSIVDTGWGIYVSLGGSLSLMLASLVVSVEARPPAAA